MFDSCLSEFDAGGVRGKFNGLLMISIKRKLKKIIASKKRLYGMYISFHLLKNALSLKNKCGSDLFIRLARASQVIDLIKQRKTLRKSLVCHVIGSGWSLNLSSKNIKAKDFCIGFNYAGIANIKFDVYLIEFGGYNVEHISRNHLNICKDRIIDETKLIFFKNLCDEKNDIDYFREHWEKVALPIRDRVYPALDTENLYFLIERIFSDESDYVPQLCSSIIISIFLAYRAGFKQIVIHGVDFGGEYFYEQLRGKISESYLPSKEKDLGLYSRSTFNSVHPTAIGTIGLRDILPIVRSYLGERGVYLYSGCAESPLSKYLPVR